jgi:hypothetical protein
MRGGFPIGENLHCYTTAPVFYPEDEGGCFLQNVGNHKSEDNVARIGEERRRGTLNKVLVGTREEKRPVERHEYT